MLIMISSNDKENNNRLTGLELDELDLPSIPEKEGSKSLDVKYRERKRLWLLIPTGLCKEKKGLSLCIAIVLCLLIGTGYLYMKEEISLVTSNQKEGPARFAIPKDQLLVFESFVIPFKQSKKFTYLSLTITVNSRDKKLMGEMIQEKNRLRGIIYDMVAEDINGGLKDVPSLEKLKKCIIRAVNGALTMGRIKEAYITDLLAV